LQYYHPFYPGRMSHPQLFDGLIEPCKTRNRSLTSEAGGVYNRRAKPRRRGKGGVTGTRKDGARCMVCHGVWWGMNLLVTVGFDILTTRPRER
jgi:hypothetical protein